MCWRKEVGLSQKFIYSRGNGASALCYMEFDLLQNISFLFKLCIFVNDLIYGPRSSLRYSWYGDIRTEWHWLAVRIPIWFNFLNLEAGWRRIFMNVWKKNVGADVPGRKAYIGMNQGLKNKAHSFLMVGLFSVISLKRHSSVNPQCILSCRYLKKNAQIP